ncbi:unnamed protein product [Protopolystoma xenopodis]|uniref:Xrn1 helical domain-containing protein n=1 Tax=Protopolystoma xenopodis TaxID=117903 RepID=A0A448XCQ7_9PLAT|nr:unnamed protein product [Protopolystoma xenopodis]
MHTTKPYQAWFDHSRPLSPLTQLMAVLPPESSNLVPTAWRHLMTSSNSPLSHMYPNDFVVEPRDHRHKWPLWMGVCLLPPIDDAQLLSLLHQHWADLKPEELALDVEGEVAIFSADSLKSFVSNPPDQKYVNESKYESSNNTYQFQEACALPYEVKATVTCSKSTASLGGSRRIPLHRGDAGILSGTNRKIKPLSRRFFGSKARAEASIFPTLGTRSILQRLLIE